MDLAMGAIDSLILKLSLLLRDEYGLQKGMKRDVEVMSRELEDMHAGLCDLSWVPLDRSDKQATLLAHDLKELSYDLEDAVDIHLARADGLVHTNLHRVKRLGEKTINLCGIKKKAGTRHQIADGTSHQFADTIKEFKSGRFNELFEQLRRCSVHDFPLPPSGTVDPRLPALYRNERELVGIDGARDELVGMMAQQGDDEPQVKIVSIVGMGGLGKTTLAKAVYNSLEARFDCSAFVSMSQQPDLKKILMAILLELDEARYSVFIIEKVLDVRQLIGEIRDFLEDKRYLIVIDDIWEIEAWKIIELALIRNNIHGSRIITTTRSYHVTRRDDMAIYYELKPLSPADSEKLFYKRIFGGEGKCVDNQLAGVSDKILKKCSGLPLAIITVASVLANKTLDKWSDVYNSIASGHESNRYVENMRMVLSFSYYDLPLHLKACLLHLSVFLEDCWIEKDLLIWMWIAEGFIQEKVGMPLFELGEEYFNELVNRSLIQIVDDQFRGRVYGCRVHPAVFSLIRFIVREENFLTVLDDELHTSPDSLIARRLALHKRNVNHNMQAANMRLEKVRSLNASLCFVDGMPQLSSFKVLRVLALEYCPGMDSNNHLEHLGNLVLLRYLGLVGISLLELPEAVRGLRFLQTLDLRETSIEQLPQAIWKLRQLMCLCVDRIARTVPEGMGDLSSLEYLRLYHVSGDSVYLATELRRLHNLRMLVIGFEEVDEGLEKALVESLGHLEEIQHLEVYCQASTRAAMWEEGSWVRSRGLRQLVLGGIWFSRLPAWISRLDRVFRLHLGVEVVEARDLEIIARLRCLCSLSLIVTVKEEQDNTVSYVSGNIDAFMRLKFFRTNIPIKFEREPGPPSLADLEFHVHVRAAKDAADSWFGSLVNLPSLQKVTVVLQCRDASAAEVEEADAALRRAIGILRQNRPAVDVVTKNEADEVPLIQHFHPKNPRFESLRCAMEKMQADRRVQVQPDKDSQEISPAKTASQ